MKKLLVVLLALGLIVAFGATASALDVKFSGQYYVAGQYESNRYLANTGERSTADFWTRARVKTVFNVAEGLTFTTQFDALEKMWGGVNQSNVTGDYDRSNSRKTGAQMSSDPAAQENIEFEQAFVTFKTGIGQFQIGYQDAETWGTGFGNTPNSRARILYGIPVGPLTLALIYEKWYESVGAPAALGNAGYADADLDRYYLTGIYNFKGGEAGLLYTFTNGAQMRGTTAAEGYRIKQHALSPYMKATFGPVYVEAELVYMFGKAKEYDIKTTAAPDVDAAGWGAYALAKMNMGPAYFGGSFGFSSGDDYGDAGKDKNGPKSSVHWSPGIIFGDANYKTWIGGSSLGGQNGVSYNMSNKQNLLALNVFGGYNPTPKINIDLQLWLLQADTAKLSSTTEAVSKKYGTEVDLTATYKIFDNLSYMVGAGYFFTGDYFKGTKESNQVGNNYVLLNKLTLNF